MIRKRTVARRVRFHCAWIAGTLMILDAVSSVWTAFDGLLPIPPLAYAGLGLAFAVASGIGHLIINDN
jgi:hypothetical protein